MRNIYFLVYIWIVITVISCSGCGETVRGMGKDAHRIGQGVRTVFIADE